MVWWNEQEEQGFKSIKSIPTYCPVCKMFLGDRFEGMLFSGHCKECRTTFRFLPGINSPISELDAKKKKECGCYYCSPRTDETEGTTTPPQS